MLHVKSGAFAAIVLLTGTFLANPASAQTYPAYADPAFGEAVREYLMAHPEVIIESLTAYQQKKAQSQQVSSKELISRNSEDLFLDPDSPVGGNSKGKVTLVEFFDYQCGYCKGVNSNVKQLLEENSNIRFVYKEYPILGSASVVAAKAALASRKQEKYEPFHDAMMDSKGPLDEIKIMNIATSVGIDVDKLRKDMEDPDIDRQIQKNVVLAQNLGVTATPTFATKTNLIPGALDLDGLKKLIAIERR